mmetsp:Transcript_87544/g.252451  ORF Transcript_87544/g.252451 Transcript_87544/m.252451 type:complete len:336 (+) Transcript_87544:129-1136(+)
MEGGMSADDTRRPPTNGDYLGDYGSMSSGGAYGVSKGIDPMMQPPSWQPPRPTYFHTMSLGLLVLLPPVKFVAVSLAMVFLYHRLPGACWTLTSLCLSVSVLFMLAPSVRDGPRYWFNLGCLTFISVVVANVASFWNMRRHFDLYWAYDGQRSYANVAPNDAALSHIDAGKILFSNDAHVDVSAAVGILAGERYCVAPIRGREPAGRVVEHWAAGVGCCGPAGRDFVCGEVGNRYARSGLVYLDSLGPEREPLTFFRKAALEAGAAHGAVPSKDALFVAWVEDPDTAQAAFWSQGLRFLLGSSLIYTGVSLVLGVMLHFGRRAEPAKNKLDSRSY